MSMEVLRDKTECLLMLLLLFCLFCGVFVAYRRWCADVCVQSPMGPFVYRHGLASGGVLFFVVRVP